MKIPFIEASEVYRQCVRGESGPAVYVAIHIIAIVHILVFTFEQPSFPFPADRYVGMIRAGSIRLHCKEAGGHCHVTYPQGSFGGEVHGILPDFMVTNRFRVKYSGLKLEWEFRESVSQLHSDLTYICHIFDQKCSVGENIAPRTTESVNSERHAELAGPDCESTGEVPVGVAIQEFHLSSVGYIGPEIIGKAGKHRPFQRNAGVTHLEALLIIRPFSFITATEYSVDFRNPVDFFFGFLFGVGRTQRGAGKNCCQNSFHKRKCDDTDWFRIKIVRRQDADVQLHRSLLRQLRKHSANRCFPTAE